MLIDTIKKARAVSTPLIAVRTPDPAATQAAIAAAYPAHPAVSYDLVRGPQWLNAPGFVVCWRILLDKGGQPPPQSEEELEPVRKDLMLKGLPEVLEKAPYFPPDTLLVLHNAQRYIDKPEIAQGLWNLRDPYTADGRTVIALGTAGLRLPAELAQDLLVFDEELPGTEELARIVARECRNAGAEPAPAELERAVDAVCGLAAFPAAQCTAMSFIRDAKNRIVLDLDALWERKRKMIENVKGLSVWRGRENFRDVGGVEHLKGFLTGLMNGAEPPRVLVLLDEFEKVMAGGGEAGGDTSGTSREIEATLLSEMEDRGYIGMIWIGIAGSSKTWLAKCAAGEFARPLILFRISDIKDKFVGGSNENLMAALQVIRSVSQGRGLFIATMNAMGTISGAMKRRFNFGTYFFDLPTPEERELIWPIHLAKFGLAGKDCARPRDDGWTGAEIRNCCLLSYRLNVPLTEAARYVTPQARIDSENIEKLRQFASNRIDSASYPGVYQFNRMAIAAAPAAAPYAPPAGRRIVVDEPLPAAAAGNAKRRAAKL